LNVQIEVIGLVGNKDNRFLPPPEHGRHPLAQIGCPVHRVYNKKDHIGFFDSHLHLLVDLLLKNVFGANHSVAGVDNRKLMFVPLGFLLI
jgi:hypothetical protein